MNPRPPVLASLGRGDAREEFCIVKRGVKMTGMPGWGFTHTDAEIWNVVEFLQVLPGLSPEAYRHLVHSAKPHEHEDGMNMPH